jgi:hypothetical protein
MAIFYEAPVNPDDLTMFTRAIPMDQNYVLNQILPDRMINDNRVDVGTLTRRGRTARFRVFDGPIHVSARDSYEVRNVALPPLSDALHLGEYERLQMQFARLQGGNQRALVDAVYDDATILTQNVRRRMEQARGDVLQDGKFTLQGEGGLWMEADYSVPAGHFVTASPLWVQNPTTADPILDITNWSEVYNTTNGYFPGGMWVPRRVMNALLRNTAMRTAYATTINGTSTLLRRDQLDQALDSYGLPPILGSYDASVDVDGVSTRILPDNKVIFVPPAGQSLGYTAWGVSATALELTQAGISELSFADAPGIVGVVVKEGPPFRQYTFVDAVGMPVLENPNGLMVATVG